MATPDMITFPGGVLGIEPVRLPIVARGEGWLAVAKPAGIAVGGDSLEAQSPDLGAAIVAALTAGKPQLANLGITHLGRVHGLDAAASGVLVLALSPGTEAQMRNAIGSRQWEFVFDVLTQTGNHPEGTTIVSDLPLTRHALEPRVLVSHATGKRCETHFTPVRTLGRWMLWEARTRDNRPHQIRVHAVERGLRIPGETTYGSVPRVFLSDLKPKYRPGRDDERPLHSSICLHLREVGFTAAGKAATRVTAPRPKSFEVLLRRLEEAASIGPRELRF
jgi:23S rRNA pseudouridine955/2504/2580 synthase